MSKVGVCEWCLPVNGPFSVDFAAHTGFDGIQLGDLGGSQKGFPMLNEFIQQGYLEAAARTGLTIHSMHLHTLVRDGGHIYPMNSPEGEAATLSIKNGVDACCAMSIPCVNISAFFGAMVKNDYDLQNLIDHLKFAVEYGKDRGIYIAYEPAVSLERLFRVLDSIPELRLNYDLLNPFSLGLGEPMEELQKIDLSVIDHIHVKDRKYNHVHQRQGGRIAGEGDGNIKALIELLKEKQYDNWYISESDYHAPTTYGLGADISTVIRSDCEAIRTLVSV